MLVIFVTVLLPLTSNMLTEVGIDHNPTAFFLILPCLCFAVRPSDQGPRPRGRSRCQWH